jgi:hypothetical protein
LDGVLCAHGGDPDASSGYTLAMTIDRILISLGVLLLIVGAVFAAITWL